MIKFNEVTWYSRLGAILFFIGVLPSLTFYIGVRYQEVKMSNLSFEKIHQNGVSKINDTTQSVDESNQGDVGVITQHSDGTSLYVSNKYKFSFTFPSSWHIGDNNIGYGTFQIMNYPEPEVGSSRFKKGQNKIEMAIISDPITFYSSESDIYPEQNNTITKTEVAGLEAFKAKGDQFYSYAIKLSSQSGKYLAISLYGDQINYQVLESLVNSISFQ